MFGPAAFVTLAWALLLRRVLAREYQEHGRLRPGVALLQVAGFAAQATALYLALTKTSWPGWPPVSWSLWCGGILFSAGVLLLAAALIAMSSIPMVLGHSTGVLRSQGVYRWCRNPQYVGYGLILLAHVVAWPSWQGGVSLLLLALIVHILVMAEEDHLMRSHGRAWLSYRERVPRYLPFLRREH